MICSYRPTPWYPDITGSNTKGTFVRLEVASKEGHLTLNVELLIFTWFGMLNGVVVNLDFL